MKLKIVSDGTQLGTKVIDQDSGESLGLIQKIEWQIAAGEAFASATVTLAKLPLEVVVIDAKVTEDEVRGQTEDFVVIDDKAQFQKVRIYENTFYTEDLLDNLPAAHSKVLKESSK